MAIDQKAFRDRVLADLIAAPLRDPKLFEASTPSNPASAFASWNETEAYIRSCAAAHRRDLFASEADEETAI